jgi:hypothetical protein
MRWAPEKKKPACSTRYAGKWGSDEYYDSCVMVTE